ncbi:MAG: V-type ATP synthase subunit A [Actinobacteria bacterium]|nr:MAG: V-type ATP synthase subunit A [Actinomycetota bacterium]
MSEGRVVKVSGPLVVAEGLEHPKMYDLVMVGPSKLMGEVIEIRGDTVSIQVYEETAGLGPTDPVYSTGKPLSVELGPGLLTNIYDGVQRPLEILKQKAGDFITRGLTANALDRDKKWDFKPSVKVGDELKEGDILGTVAETSIITHKIMVAPQICGKVKKIESGLHGVEDTICILEDENKTHQLNMISYWPVRLQRPFKQKLTPTDPLVTGQRVIDTFFPTAKGGTACIPGPFGSGKTVTQQQLAKWADAEIIIFIGCGERGNEMTDVIMEFPELIDPNTGDKLMNRTVLIANTSNMPVAAREASIYTGITIGEYFRDMGYNVSLQADSTSRWAEALREISGRLEEMPGEEGYPAYLGSRLAAFYERAGKVKCLSSKTREGSLTIIGSVSPPGGDLSEPVVQNTLRVVKVFWGLEDKLAYERHFPAINWLVSYSLYLDTIQNYWTENIDRSFAPIQKEAMGILNRESELLEIVRLVGIEALSKQERILMETAKSIREDFLQQNAYHQIDTYTSLKKQFLMLKTILDFHNQATEAATEGADLEQLLELPIREKIAKLKFIKEEDEKAFVKIEGEISKQTSQVTRSQEQGVNA